MAFVSAVPLRSAQPRARQGVHGFCVTCSTKPLFDGTVYVVTDRKLAGPRGVLWAVEHALHGGGPGRRATAVQLRDKDATYEESFALGKALRSATRRTGALLIVNDSLDLAIALDADGLHVGQDDTPASAVRAQVPILGVSAGTSKEAAQAVSDGADYIGVGDIFGTSTKKDAGNPIGLDSLEEIASSVDIPVIAIGGITTTNAEICAAYGAHGVAVVSAVMQSFDPATTVSSLADSVNRGRNRARARSASL